MTSEAQSESDHSEDLLNVGAVGQEDTGGDSGVDMSCSTVAPDHPNALGESSQTVTPVTQKLDEKLEGAASVAPEAINGEIQVNRPNRWDTSASLYCAKNGTSHSYLLDFELQRCPLCGQDVSQPEFKQGTSRRSSTSSWESESAVTDSDPGATLGKCTGIEDKRVQHAVEYRDAGGLTITVKEFNSPFNFNQERSRATANVGTILKIVTVLNTSVPRNSSWFDYEVRKLERDMPLIENPKYSMHIGCRKLVIQSHLFIRTLQEVCSYNTGSLLDARVIELQEPYAVIGHHLDKLKARRKDLSEEMADNANEVAPTSSQQELCDHLDVVIEYIDVIYQDFIGQELTCHASTPPKCTYRMLWLLYKPGSTVYVDTSGKWDAYVFESIEFDEAVLSTPSEDLRPCRIRLWNLDFDGRLVTRRRKIVVLQPFTSERDILSLKVVPSEYWDALDHGELRAKLENEGKKWYGLLLGSQVNYSGELANRRKRWLDGRAFADSAAYYEFEASWRGPYDGEGQLSGSEWVADDEDKTHDQWQAYDNIDPTKVKSLELPSDAATPVNHRNLLCARYLWGFVFATRTWEYLDVVCCHNPKLNRTPFERLMMPDEQKMMIKALVYKYTDPRFAGSDPQKVWAADFIKNKGEGQIFLLHGGPGVGKTFTAECIAEFTGRPLLAITCGDLGTDEVAMERELGKWLNLAHKWGAVMLIDEADVFLEKRMESDLKRNSLVSVFLRELEYYQGILFLTTNRVGQFDDAFVSRIHIVIHYHDLSDDYRRKIWNQFFDKLQDERGDVIKIENSARRYVLEEPQVCSHKWNGREIRNAFQTAVALAEYRFLTKPEMEKSEGEIAVLNDRDFKQVCEMAMEFKNYLKGVNNGEDEQERAGRAQWRLGPNPSQDQYTGA